MTQAPFILLDDARAVGAGAVSSGAVSSGRARLYTVPEEIVVARRPDEVEPALARIGEQGGSTAIGVDATNRTHGHPHQASHEG